jgi:type IV secretory pathway VirB10-like protein
MTADALSGAAWASIGAGVLVALLIVGAVLVVTRSRTRPPEAPAEEVWQPTTRVEEPAAEPPEEPRQAPPPLDTTMIRWDRKLPPVPPPKPRDEP